eukprot:7383735-Prymnesium_polylepis.1
MTCCRCLTTRTRRECDGGWFGVVVCVAVQCRLPGRASLTSPGTEASTDHRFDRTRRNIWCALRCK